MQRQEKISRGLRVGIVVFGALVLAILWTSVLLQITRERRLAMEQAFDDTGNLARVLEEHVAGLFRSVDQALTLLEYATISQGGAIPDLARLADSTLASRSGFATRLSVIGPDGRMLASSLLPIDSTTDFSVTDEFKVSAQNPLGDLFLGVPVLDRATRRWTMTLSRPLRNAEGGFAGVALISVDPSYLTRFYDSLEVGQDGVVTLLGLDGKVRARSSRGLLQHGNDIAKARVFDELLKTPTGFYRSHSIVDGVDRLFSYRKLPDLPLVLLVGEAERDIMQPLRHSQRLWLVVAGIFTATILLAIFLLLRGARSLDDSRRQANRAQARTAQAEQRLLDAVNSMSEGLMLWDAEDRLVLINQQSFQMEPGRYEGIVPGMHFEHVVRTQLGRGLIVEAIGSEKDYLAGRLEQHRGPPEEAMEYQTASGQWIRLRERRTAEGGVVSIRTDVTREKRREAELLFLATTDPLTGLLNRRAFLDQTRRELDRARRHSRDLGLLVLDLDHFKRVNDEHGHEAGDEVLRAVTAAFKETVRATDVMGRIGGEEFTVLLPETGPEGAERAAESIRAAVESLCVPSGDALISPTISIGVADLGRSHSLEAAFALADRALYAAKHAGRNRVVAAAARMEGNIAG